VTLVTVLSIVAVVSVYAVLVGTFTGGEVTVGGTGAGNVMYSLVNSDPGTWESTLGNASAAWYSRLELATGGYTGPVSITWQLQKKVSGWTDVSGATTTTSLTLTGSQQTIYVTSNGLISGNNDWGANVTGSGGYRVMAYVNSA